MSVRSVSKNKELDLYYADDIFKPSNTCKNNICYFAKTDVHVIIIKKESYEEVLYVYNFILFFYNNFIFINKKIKI